MSFPPRLVSVLVPVQWLCVLLGYSITRKLIKVALEWDTGSIYRPKVPALIGWVSQTGWLFLTVPIVWGVHATLCADHEEGFAELQPRDAKVGLGLTLFAAGAAFWSIVETLGWMESLSA